MKIYLSLIIIMFLTGCTNQPVVNVEENEDLNLQIENNIEAEDLKLLDEEKQEIQIDSQEKEVIEQEKALPKKVNLKVKFVSQAPNTDWGLPYQEACEETALIQASKYFNDEDLDKGIMDEEILKLVEWEKAEFGLYTDTNLAEVKIIAEKYFNLNVEISSDISIENFKTQLASGKLILVPTAGRYLSNPNFSGAGPIYHFLVIRGYDSDDFIVNDVGTRKGEGYKYKFQTVINAIHDLPLNEDGSVFRPYDSKIDDKLKAEKILLGEKRILIVNK